MATFPPFQPEARPTFVEPPNLQWDFGEKTEVTDNGREWIEGEKVGWKYIDSALEPPLDLYKLMISGIVPRPVAFVSSESASGVQNLAPFSWFNMVTHNPPVVSVSVANPGGGAKDTTANIRATKQFVVNIINEPFIHQANATSIDAPEEVSEWPLSGLTQAPSISVKPPRVKESAFSMECELYDVVDIKHPSTGVSSAALILGLVKGIHVRKDVLNEKGLVDITKFRPITRLGDISYGRIGDVFRIPRPVWKEEAEKVAELEKKGGT
ncbi:hypothetical protein K488DRAFT_58467 [Vararia minispora EC-137]|uniref:Uncharacterized protein n=1 Tax=Vararia minispora EC-137 TaxID=1314806 RepID=A0ACB8QA64_9AGAM|nr:hypothetical protein K488DRAFT_58467 [Vararia minispora EC-137]